MINSTISVCREWIKVRYQLYILAAIATGTVRDKNTQTVVRVQMNCGTPRHKGSLS